MTRSERHGDDVEAADLTSALQRIWTEPNLDALLEHGLRSYEQHQVEQRQLELSARRSRLGNLLLLTVTLGFLGSHLVAVWAQQLGGTPTSWAAVSAGLHEMLITYVSTSKAVFGAGLITALLHHQTWISLLPFSILILFGAAMFLLRSAPGSRSVRNGLIGLVFLIISMPKTTLAYQLEGSLPRSRPISISLVDVSRVQALHAVAEQAGISVVTDATTESNKVSVVLQRATLDTALRAVLPENATARFDHGLLTVVFPTPVPLTVDALTARTDVAPVQPAPATPATTPTTATAERTDEVVLWGEDHRVTAQQTARDVVLFGGNATIDGHVEHDVVVFGGNVHVTRTGVVDHDLVVFGGGLTIDPGATVRGKKIEFGQRSFGVVRDNPTRSATSDATREHRAGRAQREAARVHHHGGSTGTWISLALVLLASLCTLSLWPKRWKTLQEWTRMHPWQNLGMGFAAIVTIPLILLALVISCIGIPVAATLIFPIAFSIFVGLGLMFDTTGGWVLGLGIRGLSRISPALAEKATAWIQWPSIRLVFGVVLLLISWIIPPIGAIFLAIMVLMGLGAVIHTHFGRTKNVQTGLAAMTD